MSQSGDVIVGGGGVTIVTGLPLNGGGGGGGGSTTLAGLSDVSVAGATNGQVLTYNGTVWVAAAPAGGVPTSRQVIAGTGLSGGGDLTADRTLAVVFGTAAGTVCQGNDARLSDARTPTAHTHTASQISDSTATGRALMTAADAAAGRSTLGLGTLATQSGTFSGTSSGTNTGDQSLFSTIAVAGQSNVVADSTSDTLTLVAGANVTITTDAATDTITIAATGGGGGGVTDHGALTGLADDDHTQYLISNVGTSTTRNSITMGTGARGLNIESTDSVDPWVRLTTGGLLAATWSAETGIVIEPGQGEITADKLNARAATTGGASLNIPHGTAPTSPVNGDIWTTTSGVFARVNGSTVGPIGVPPGSTNQIIRNVSGAFAASSDLTFDAASNGGLSVLNGHFIFGGSLPSRHTQTSGFKGIWVGGNNTNACLMGETTGGFRGYELQANVVRGTSPNNWFCQDTTQPAWQMFNGYETSGSDTWLIRRAPATALDIGSTWRTILQLDRNLRSAFAAADYATTTGFTAKLAVDNVGGTASDAVLQLRGNASQSGPYLRTETSGGTALFTVDSAGKANTIASTTAAASLTIPHGTAPSIPVNGDVWTTTAGMFVRVNGATVGPLTQAGQCVRGVFGDGSEGDFTTTGNLTLSEPRNWNNLTVATGHTITTAGWRIHVRNILTLNGTGRIERNGANGGNATSATGGSAGAALTAQSTGASGAGTAGGNGTTTAGAQGAAPGAVLAAALGVSNSAVNSGAGGTGASGAGGAVRAGAAATPRRVRAFTIHLIDGVTQLNGSAGGAGGGGGGGDGTNSGGGGGGGGSGGGICFIAARNIVLNTGTSITANGGNGGNGRTPTVGNCGGGGGGAGGAGGVVYLIYETLTNSGTISANGGTGGTGGNGVGTGTAGTNGGAGATGLVIRYNTTTGAFE